MSANPLPPLARVFSLSVSALLLFALTASAGPRPGGGGRPGGRPGGGTKPGRPQPSLPNPSDSRRSTSERVSQLLQGGSPSAQDLSQLLGEGSTGGFPSRSSSRSGLSAQLSQTLAGKKLTSAQAAAVSEALAAAANPDGLSKEELSAKKSQLSATLKQAGASEEAVAKVTAAFDQVVSDQQQANLKKLGSDLQALQGDSEVTDAQVQALKSSLRAMADGATKPSQESVNKLATDLSAALDDGSLSTKEQAQLVFDLQTVLNSAHIPPAEVQAAIADAQAILKASNVDSSDVQLIASDLQAIYASMPHPVK
ncbi:MAG: hypothetical protein HYZ53_18600 [Planctomycetes bacterium]|nr:hypothetical protein [Planctomycetota bacterium]